MLLDVARREYHCRECAAKGTTHHDRSKVPFQYSVCRACWLLKHSGDDDFVEHSESNLYCGIHRVNARSVFLGQDIIVDGGDGSKDTTAPVENASVEVWESCSQQACTSFQSLVANNTSLAALDISFWAAGKQTEAVKALVTGLQASTSIRSVSLHLKLESFHGMISKEAASAVQDLIKHEGSIQHVTIRLTSSTHLLETGWFDDLLFDALIDTKLSTFAYYGVHPVSDRNKEKTWKAMFFNASIRRIEVDQFDNPDYRLSLLEAEKKYKWMNQWVSRGNNHGTILERALDFPLDSADQVPLLYHFLRERPDILVGQASKVMASLSATAIPVVRITNMHIVKAQTMTRKAKGGPNFYCWCCQRHFRGGEDFREHLESKQHKQKERMECRSNQTLARGGLRP